MGTNNETTSLSLAQNAAHRGAGGKLMKQSSRKPPATPYARPQQQSRWLSKLVDPAYRLITGGATRILPSFFSNYKSHQHSLPAPTDQQLEDHHEILDAEEEECAEDGAGVNHGESRSTDVAGPSSTADRSKNGFDFDGSKQDKRENAADNDRLSEIEQLLEGKSFSRDEIHRLIEIIHSRAVDLPEQEKKLLSTNAKGDAERPMVALENPRKSIEEKQEDLSKTPWGTSTTPLQSSMQDKVGASPIDIAKAYMGTRTSELGLGSKSLLSKDERISPNGNEFALKPYFPSPSHKPSTCWPGAMLQDQRDYLTPHSERGRYGLHNFPRTPYSRTIFSKSKSGLTQLQGDSNKGLNTSTPLQQSQTPIYGQLKSSRNALDNGQGSAGPIRRTRHKAAVESLARGSVKFHSSVDGLSPVGHSHFSEFPAVKKNLELGGTSGSSIFQLADRKPLSSEVGVPPVHPHSSQMARTILEHLERNLPTPKDKSAELGLATSRKKIQSSVSASVVSEQNIFLNFGGCDSRKKGDEGDNKNSAQVNEARVNSFKVTSPENTKVSKDGINETSLASKTKIDGVLPIQGGRAGSSHDFRKNQDFDIESKNENNSKTVPNAADSGVLNLQRKPPSHSVGDTKSVLPSISVGKPNWKWTFSSDSSTGFSFPVSASSGVFSEPPTPSILPSFLANDVQQPKEGPAVPKYSFGLNTSTSRLVFAFPSTSSAPTNDDASDLKFNFRSDKTTRISFSSIGKDAICY
ncbi:nucleoporin-like protein [Citrus sinensis]|uniref:Nucleoporin-like protein n=3 Tax=Citrus sinensis TaxID=2711 RepID=A0ACB8NRZ1_CITSI|nr:nuclear pore complex protein NUP1 isoform X1 [Citrus sinensis]KAH9761767.1 nucleoporin-like protein [Citrus sinensis]KAH9800155.1 nucleoporin-like protein [Citrus sinensis]KDO80213.1 hypothetical protein CISIN_1g004515mg [Citrus sinensis]